jgi:hypothetical protein
MRLPSDLWKEAGTLLNIAWNWFRNHWQGFTAVQALLLICIWFGLHPRDHQLITLVRGSDPNQYRALAGWLSKWGDFPGFNLFLALGLWLAGHFRQ